MIKDIIKDFDKDLIPAFFDLNYYATDYEIFRKIERFLRVGYIKKVEINYIYQ